MLFAKFMLKEMILYKRLKTKARQNLNKISSEKKLAVLLLLFKFEGRTIMGATVNSIWN